MSFGCFFVLFYLFIIIIYFHYFGRQLSGTSAQPIPEPLVLLFWILGTLDFPWIAAFIHTPTPSVVASVIDREWLRCATDHDLGGVLHVYFSFSFNLMQAVLYVRQWFSWIATFHWMATHLTPTMVA